jgi:hypothetical protein
MNNLVHVYPTWGPEHDIKGWACWCQPTPDKEDPNVVVHREPEEACH